MAVCRSSHFCTALYPDKIAAVTGFVLLLARIASLILALRRAARRHRNDPKPEEYVGQDADRRRVASEVRAMMQAEHTTQRLS